METFIETDYDYKIENIKIQEEKTENKNINYTSFTDCTDENFKKKLGKYTFGLDKIIPWEDLNFIFSGGLLYDIITNRFSQDLTDIDLFFYGSLESKLGTINKLLDNLDKNQYSYLIGHYRSVIYIFIQGIPRIIQLIMTDKNGPESIINQFDLMHLKSFTDGNKLFCFPEVIEHLKKGMKTSIYKIMLNKFFHKNRIIKYTERGVLSKNIMTENYHWILSQNEALKYINYKKQIKLYKTTFNLTKYFDNKIIDFMNFDKNKICLFDYFHCYVEYCKLDNHDFIENVDMFGSFAEYFGVKKNELISGTLNLNETNEIIPVNNKFYTNINKCELVLEKNYNYLSKLFYISGDKTIYIPCNFIKTNDINFKTNNINFKTNNQEDENKILNMNFEIKNKNIINYLKTKINKYFILDSLNISKIGIDLIESKYKLDLNNIFMPFTNEDNSNNYKDDSLIICSKLYNKDIDEFFEINEFGILDTLQPDENINCLFDIVIYLSVSKNQQRKKKIDYIDINLKLRYIYKNT